VDEGVYAFGDGWEVDVCPGCGVVAAGIVVVVCAEVGGGEGVGDGAGIGLVEDVDAADCGGVWA